MDLIERLCDRIILLDHGKAIFQGDPLEGINRYRLLLNTEKFSVEPGGKQPFLVENTKKWADDISHWGEELGTKEVMITKVEFLNWLGMRTFRIKSGGRLKIKVHFTVRNPVKEPHFGIAIFRKDGVYCYGPNTQFDGLYIRELKEGKGYFMLDLKNVWLTRGEYRISVAIWDKNETLAFSHHYGCYVFVIRGDEGGENGICAFPFIALPRSRFNFQKCPRLDLTSRSPNGAEGQQIKQNDILAGSFKLLDRCGKEKSIFKTNETVKIEASLCVPRRQKDVSRIRLGIYRDDGVYCQGITVPVAKKKFNVVFPRFPLLPGGYVIRFQVWDEKKEKFLVDQRNGYAFNMVFERHDHGTVCLEHEWSWELP